MTNEPAQPGAPSGRPSGEVYDLGYQHYNGPREGRSRARKALFWNGVRTVLGIGRGAKAKILPALLFVAAMLPAVVFVMILSFLPAVPNINDFVPGPADYYGVIATLMLLFSAIMAPELLAPDRRDRVIDLYLVRPLTSTDYLLARFFAFFVIVLALAYSGQIVLLVGLTLTAAEPVDYLRDNWQDIPRVIGAGVLVALFVTVIPLAVAAFTTRRAIASVFIIGLFFTSTAVADSLTTSTNCTFSEGERVCESATGDAAKWFALISMSAIPLRMNDMVFDAESDAPAVTATEELHDSIPIAVYALFTIGPGMLLWRQYRRLQI